MTVTLTQDTYDTMMKALACGAEQSRRTIDVISSTRSLLPEQIDSALDSFVDCLDRYARIVAVLQGAAIAESGNIPTQDRVA